uniref:Uncharacterized protein n=1 Tax=Moniliophthora roreri TaxID=221103 RepID=A0A0W0G2V2_MONRR
MSTVHDFHPSVAHPPTLIGDSIVGFRFRAPEGWTEVVMVVWENNFARAASRLDLTWKEAQRYQVFTLEGKSDTRARAQS